MPKGPPPSWRSRDCSFDHLVVAAVSEAPGQLLKYTGIEDLERAHAIRRGIYRCAKHRGLSAAAGPSGRIVEGPEDPGVHKRGQTYEVWYLITDKRTGRRQHLERYGNDRSRWPYDPRRKATAAERENWAARDESGRTVTYD